MRKKPENHVSSGPAVTRKKYTPAFKDECVRQVAADRAQTRGNGARHFKKSRDQQMLEAHYLPTASIMSRYAFIAACAEPWPVVVVCRVLGVSTSGYYQWRGAKPGPAAAW